MDDSVPVIEYKVNSTRDGRIVRLYRLSVGHKVSSEERPHEKYGLDSLITPAKAKIESLYTVQAIMTLNASGYLTTPR